MYAFIQGTVEDVEQDRVSVNCGGVGYEILTTNTAIGKCAVGQAAKFYTYLAVREDALTLYGFLQKDEKEMFLRLIGVSGVGPKVGLAILSVLSPDRVVLAVSAGDHKAFTAASGVGPKLGQRIVLELKDKVGKGLATGLGLADASGTAAPAATGGVAQAIAALTGLGYTGSEAAQAIARLDPSLPVQELIRLALQGIGKGR